jgi:PBP1b-binding outer membrane lipoprotein LpoB
MRLTLIAPILAAILLAAGCSSTEEAAPAATAAPTTAAPETSPASALDTVPEALQFTSTLVDGTAFDAATLAGGDVLFWFWAPT